jgi:hypothetical protein
MKEKKEYVFIVFDKKQIAMPAAPVSTIFSRNISPHNSVTPGMEKNFNAPG